MIGQVQGRREEEADFEIRDQLTLQMAGVPLLRDSACLIGPSEG